MRSSKQIQSDLRQNEVEARLAQIEREQLAYDRAKKKALFNEYCFLDTEGKPIKNNWHHTDWFVEAEMYRYLLEMAAREHAKTEIFAKADPLYEIAENPNIRILLISDVFPQSQQRARVLKEHITSNPRYKEWCKNKDGFTFPEIVSKEGDYSFTVRRSMILKEPTVVSTYAGGPIAGGRYDIIIVDDLVSVGITQGNSNTIDKRAKLKRWWDDDVLNSMPPWGKIRMIGTPRHHRDLHTEVEKDSRFVVIKRPGVDEEETGYGHLGYTKKNEARGITPDEGWNKEDAACLWPEMHNHAAQMQKKDNTPDSYLSQQQLILVPDTGLVYRKPLTDAAFERGKFVQYDPQAEQYIGFDPGYGIRASMLAIQERAGDRVDLWREHSFTEMADEEIVEVMIEHIAQYRVSVVFYDAEDPGFGKALINAISSRGLGCKVQPVPFGKWKRLSIKATRWLLGMPERVAWKGVETIVHRPGRSRIEPSIFHEEIRDYALKPGEDDMPIKDDDHGPDAWHSYMVKWIGPWAKATGQSIEALTREEEKKHQRQEVGGLLRGRLSA